MVLISASTFAQNTASQIRHSILAFVSLGDSNDAENLETVLHDQHRLIWNDGTKAPFIADKSLYLSKIASGEWGGDQREVTIESIEIFDEANASVKAILDGSSAQMRSIFLLIKENDDWKIITELVNATFK